MKKWLWLLIGVCSLGFITVTADRYFEISRSMEIFGDVYKEVNQVYVDETSPTDLMRTGINAMLGNLDPYTNYYSESQIDYSKLINSGQYSGIGAEVDLRNGEFILIEMIADGPADMVGLKVGDVIRQIDQETVTDKTSIDQIRNLLLGEKGSTLTIYVSREEESQPVAYTVTRGGTQAQQENVPFYGMVNDSIGYILQTGFTGEAAFEVAQALTSLNKNDNLVGLILDLRGNPGGRLDQAVAICNLFVPAGELIVEMRGRSPETQNKFRTRQPAIAPDLPLAVLVNNRSASAAEIVAGGLQDLDRGIVVGQRSFGKGLVQNIRPLSYNTQMKITVAKYYTPSGRCIQAIDYAQRNADGSVSRTPDSLSNEFLTRAGRPVYDGVGIDPDVYVDKPELQPISKALIEQNYIFNFATDYASRNDSIESPKKFEVTEKIFSEFVSFVESSSRELTYTTQSEIRLKKLEEKLQSEGYDAETKGRLESISQKINRQKQGDLTRFKDEIMPLIRKEIINRYYYKQGVIESSFIHDADILTAIDILRDNSKYISLLKPRQ